MQINVLAFHMGTLRSERDLPKVCELVTEQGLEPRSPEIPISAPPAASP